MEGNGNASVGKDMKLCCTVKTLAKCTVCKARLCGDHVRECADCGHKCVKCMNGRECRTCYDTLCKTCYLIEDSCGNCRSVWDTSVTGNDTWDDMSWTSSSKSTQDQTGNGTSTD